MQKDVNKNTESDFEEEDSEDNPDNFRHNTSSNEED